MDNFNIKFDKFDLRSLRRRFGESETIINERLAKKAEQISRKQKDIIEGTPWEIGQDEGGVPVATGQLKRDHRYRAEGTQAKVKVDNPYAWYVHQGTSNLEARPWLNYSITAMDDFLDRELNSLLENITEDLAK